MDFTKLRGLNSGVADFLGWAARGSDPMEVRRNNLRACSGAHLKQHFFIAVNNYCKHVDEHFKVETQSSLSATFQFPPI